MLKAVGTQRKWYLVLFSLAIFSALLLVIPNIINQKDAECGNGVVCPNSQCCSSQSYCGSSVDHCGIGCQSKFGTCILAAKSLDSADVQYYFKSKTPLQYGILFVSMCALTEWIIFTSLTLMTFRNVYKNPDATTSKRAVIVCSITYLLLRSIFLPFYFAGTFITFPGYKEEQSQLLWTIGIGLTVWWNILMVLPYIAIKY